MANLITFPKGISGKSQILFAIVFTTRYLDLLSSFISLYNTSMKVRHQSSLSSRTGPTFLLGAVNAELFFVVYPGDLHRMCVCYSLPDLHEVQGHLWRQPWQLQSGVPRRSCRRSRCSHQPWLLFPGGGFDILCFFDKAWHITFLTNWEFPFRHIYTEIYLSTDPVDVLHLPGVGCNPASALHDQQDRRGGDNHHPLPVLPGPVSGPLSLQLDLALLLWRLLWHDRHCGRSGPDCPLLRLLLPLCH